MCLIRHQDLFFIIWIIPPIFINRLIITIYYYFLPITIHFPIQLNHPYLLYYYIIYH